MNYNNVKLEEPIDKQIRDARRSKELEEAYQKSPKKYSELFDKFQREDREARKQAGKETIDDMFAELEEKRERIPYTR